MFQWRKKGLCLTPDGRFPWFKTHASLPVGLPMGGDVYRIYFASRDEDNRSHVGYCVLDLNRPDRILDLSSEPVLSPGPLGHFDDHGVYAASIVDYNRKLYMFYIGWNPGTPPPLFYASIGLAVSDDGGETFQKMFKSPLLTRSEVDPCLVTSPFVLVDGGRWRMWYVSGFKWEQVGDELHSYYHIKYAESANGIDWDRDGRVAIGHNPGERNIARPCVLKTKDQYLMWYSYNAGSGYRIGFAQSRDGYEWVRKDETVGINLSADGWDSNAMAYPHVFLHQNRYHMFYNGNGFGKEGFGLATYDPQEATLIRKKVKNR